jgi:hypothetical protein
MQAMCPHFPAPCCTQEVHDTVADDIRGLLAEISAKGPLATYLQADILLGRFKQVTQRLHAAISRLPLEEINVPAETCEEMAAVLALLERARFDLTPHHASVLSRYQDAVSREDWVLSPRKGSGKG